MSEVNRGTNEVCQSTLAFEHERLMKTNKSKKPCYVVGVCKVNMRFAAVPAPCLTCLVGQGAAISWLYRRESRAVKPVFGC